MNRYLIDERRVQLQERINTLADNLIVLIVRSEPKVYKKSLLLVDQIFDILNSLQLAIKEGMYEEEGAEFRSGQNKGEET